MKLLYLSSTRCTSSFCANDWQSSRSTMHTLVPAAASAASLMLYVPLPSLLHR